MKTVILTIGPPGCGKSTWAKAQMQASGLHSSKFMHINRDELRNMLTMGQYDQGKYDFDREGLITKITDQMVEEFQKRDSVERLIISDTNMKVGLLKNNCEKFIKLGFTVFVKTFFTTSLDTLTTRVEERHKAGNGPPIPRFAIESMFNQIPNISIYIEEMKRKELIRELN